jgi:acyl-CoA thioester hydrolase
VTSIGGWLDLKARKLIEPPEVIKSAWNSLPKTDDFEVLRSSVIK